MPYLGIRLVWYEGYPNTCYIIYEVLTEYLHPYLLGAVLGPTYGPIWYALYNTAAILNKREIAAM